MAILVFLQLNVLVNLREYAGSAISQVLYLNIVEVREFIIKLIRFWVTRIDRVQPIVCNAYKQD